MENIAKKLKEMRESRGLTLEEAAKLAGYRNFQTLSKIENRKREVKVDDLVTLAKIYSFDINLFLIDEQKPKDIRLFWRSTPNPPKDINIQTKFTMLFERYMHLIELLDLSNSNLSLPMQQIQEMNLKNADSLGESYSSMLRLGDKPALSLVSILENECHLPIFFLILPEGASALSLIANCNVAICVHQNDAPWRQRFDIAHELFHIIHQKFSADKCGASDASLFEKCANAFAAALLLPKNALDKEIDIRRNSEKTDIAALIAMACNFGVSLPALIWRLVNIRRMKRSQAKEILQSEALKNHSKKLRRKEERNTVYLSHRYLCMVFEAVNKGIMSKMRAAEYSDTSPSKLVHIFQNAGLVLPEESNIEVSLM